MDRYAGTIAGLREQIPSSRELRAQLPAPSALYESPAGNSDGGYAVSSYRRVDPALGTIEELAELAAELRSRGSRCVLDFRVQPHLPDAAESAGSGRGTALRTVLLDPPGPHPSGCVRAHGPGDFARTTTRGVSRVWTAPRPGAPRARRPRSRWVWTTFHRFQSGT
ncbi:alpha-amylase family glycosyl hydrolase [Kocuria rhizophila]|nr:alpha-amylase family glycosyl hydrolase [Kocuria rhizophila]